MTNDMYGYLVGDQNKNIVFHVDNMVHKPCSTSSTYIIKKLNLS